MMRGPPAAPATRRTLPSATTIVGDMLLRGRLPGWGRFLSDCRRPYALGLPGIVVKSSISLFSANPNPGTTTIEPKVMLIVSVQATAMPFSSITDRWLVPPSSGIGLTEP